MLHFYAPKTTKFCPFLLKKHGLSAQKIIQSLIDISLRKLTYGVIRYLSIETFSNFLHSFNRMSVNM